MCDQTEDDKNFLTITDSLTNTTIKVPIHPTLNYIPASAFAQLRIKPTTPPGVLDTDTVPVRLYDPGFRNTIVCRSKVSLVDGEQGRLFYRGYDVNTLVEQSNFLEVAYLLIYGELPGKLEYQKWSRAVMMHTYLHTELEKQMAAFRYDAHPMGMLIATLASLSTFHPEANPALRGDGLYMMPKIPKGQEPTPAELASIQVTQDARNRAIFRILGKTSTIAANAFRHRMGRQYNHSMPGSFNFAENFLCMLDKLNETDYKPDPRLVKILDKLFILLAEHGSNCSTVTMRHLASSGVDPYTAASGAAGALFGERKSSAVIHMLRMIGKVENVHVFLSLVKRKQTIVAGPNGTLIAATDAAKSGGSADGINVKKTQPTRLMGFGHRIYKTHDPRVKLVKDLTMEVFDLMGKGQLGELALALEEAVTSDEWFERRKIFPNIDFWSAIVFHSMGFPPDMFPVLTCVPRMAGFIAHWQESLDDPEYKIFRPRQIYIGEVRRSFPVQEQERLAEASANPAPELDKLTSKSLPSAAKKRMSAIVNPNEVKFQEFTTLLESTQKNLESVTIEEQDETLAAKEASRLAIGPISSWVMKTFFDTKTASPPSERILTPAERLAKTREDLQLLLQKQKEMLELQQEQQRALEMSAGAASSSSSSIPVIETTAPSQGPQQPPVSPNAIKKEPDLLAGSKSPRVMAKKGF